MDIHWFKDASSKWLYIYICIIIYIQGITARVLEIQELLGDFKTEISNVEIDIFLFKILGSERFLFYFLNKLILVFRRNSINWSKVAIKHYTDSLINRIVQINAVSVYINYRLNFWITNMGYEWKSMVNRHMSPTAVCVEHVSSKSTNQ